MAEMDADDAQRAEGFGGNEIDPTAESEQWRDHTLKTLQYTLHVLLGAFKTTNTVEVAQSSLKVREAIFWLEAGEID